jgi:hypothetical protein
MGDTAVSHDVVLRQRVIGMCGAASSWICPALLRDVCWTDDGLASHNTNMMMTWRLSVLTSSRILQC